MRVIKCLFITLAGALITGCQTTEAPESLDKYSHVTNAGYVTYKRTSSTHRAFAVAKSGNRDFYGYASSYSTLEEAQARAISECESQAKQFNRQLNCYIFHSE